MYVTHALLMLCQDIGKSPTMPSQYFVHSKAERAGRCSTAQHTVRADTHTQHFVSHLEGACVVDGKLAGLRAILFHNGPLPKLDFLIGTATHKASAVMPHNSAAVTSEKPMAKKHAQSACTSMHAPEGDASVLWLASVLPCKYLAQVAGDQMGLP